MSAIRERLSSAKPDIIAAWNCIEEQLTHLLPRINKNFREFTIHDAGHCFALESILDWLVEPAAWKAMSDHEVFVLLSALWSHDLGMAATMEQAMQASENYSLPLPYQETLLLFLRDHHPRISRTIIEPIIRALDNPTLRSLATIVGDIAESHGARNLEALQTTLPVGYEGSVVRPVFLAMLLRLADILHCTADRAPMQLFNARAITNPTSVNHWRTHQATVGVGADATIRAIRVHIDTDDVICFEWATKYLQSIQTELDYCAAVTTRTNLHASEFQIVAFKCIATSETPFVSEVVKVAVDPQAAIATLVGKNIYDDHSVFVRELLQNALDAVRLRARLEAHHVPRIEMAYNTASGTLTVIDNGIGMSLADLTGSLFCSCTSGFRRYGDVSTLLAKFGIGFLSVFMVANRVTVRTRRWDAALADGWTATVTTVQDPIDIRATQGLPIGTSIAVEIMEGVTLDASSISKWLPSPAGVVSATIDSATIDPPPLPQGAAHGLEILRKDFVGDAPNIRLILHAVAVVDANGITSPCGLSFQNLEQADPRMSEMPHVKSRYFINGIPFVGQRGERPTYPAYNHTNPLIERLFAPVDVDFLQPGMLDLNLARNQFLNNANNRSMLDSAGAVCLDLLLQSYRWLRTRTSDRALLAARFVGEHWLTRIVARPDPGKTPDDPDVLAAYREIWSDVRVGTWNLRTQRYEPATLGELAAGRRPLVLFRMNRLATLVVEGFKMERIARVVMDQLGESATIVDELANNTKSRYSLYELLMSTARSYALFDTYAFGVQHAPLYVFETDCDAPFPRQTCALQVFGTDALFLGEQPRAVCTGMLTGNNQPSLILNLRSPDYSDEISRLVQNGRRLLPSANRISIHDWLREKGIPDDILAARNMHPTLMPQYPLAGPILLNGL